MAGLFQRIAQNYRKKKKITQPSARLNAKEDKTEHAGKVTRAKERIHSKVEKEDFLLSQIDEFREKAKQLQNLLTSKESKVQELQNLVNEREDKAQELEQILSERQEEADEIVSDFSKKVDELAERVTAKMNEIEISVSKQVAASKKLGEDQIEAGRQFIEEQTAANKKVSDEQVAEVKALLENATSQLDSIKTDLSEKVHSENVKCYRNIQDLFNEFDSKIEKMDEMEKSVGAVKGYVKVLSWFSIINFVMLVAFILYSLGVFNF